MRLILYFTVGWFLFSIALALFLGRLCGLNDRIASYESLESMNTLDTDPEPVGVYAALALQRRRTYHY